LQSLGFGAGSFLQNLDKLGFFTYVLPFLLLFAVIYAILILVPTFQNNKGAAVLIAVAAGLLALQFVSVPLFFAELFKNLGIGVAILLVAMILVGAFLPWEKTGTAAKWIIFGTGVIIFIAVSFSSLSSAQFIGSDWWDKYGAIIIVIAVIIASIVGVILASKGKSAGT